MPDRSTGALVRLSHIERRVGAVSLAACAEVPPLIGPLWFRGDVLAAVCLGQG